MLRLTRLILLVLSLTLGLGLAVHGVAAAGMNMTMASAPSSLGGQMGDCDTCTGKAMKSSALCDALCDATVGIVVETPVRLDIFPLLLDCGMITAVRAVGRVPPVNLAPPRIITLI